MKSRPTVFVCTIFAMLAFASNSLLCRWALMKTAIDPTSFTTIRIVAGALTLRALVRWRCGAARPTGNWPSAMALFVYAAAISIAYTRLSAATGALILFGAVQVTMVGFGALNGERVRGWRMGGIAIASAGLVALLSPGASAPPLSAAAAMFTAGAAWGVYSLRGATGGDPLCATAGNFVRAMVPAAALSFAMLTEASADPVGIVCAVVSGAAASGIGYALWYAALPSLDATTAATVQLTVPVTTAVAGLVLLNETPTPQVVLYAMIVLGGIAIVVFSAPSVRERRP